jgi:hypothetical protein
MRTGTIDAFVPKRRCGHPELLPVTAIRRSWAVIPRTTSAASRSTNRDRDLRYDADGCVGGFRGRIVHPVDVGQPVHRTYEDQVGPTELRIVTARVFHVRSGRNCRHPSIPDSLRMVSASASETAMTWRPAADVPFILEQPLRLDAKIPAAQRSPARCPRSCGKSSSPRCAGTAPNPRSAGR